jgi:hypothetical protein|tara:strand:+ start:214 stop:411 length:198 start_codon:yes stop_codon:yes gene_type:complete
MSNDDKIIQRLESLEKQVSRLWEEIEEMLQLRNALQAVDDDLLMIRDDIIAALKGKYGINRKRKE